MAGEVKNVEDGETRKLEHGMVRVVQIGSVTMGRAQFEPGWRWSNDVKPIAKTDLWMVHHTGYCISGRLHISPSDGRARAQAAGVVERQRRDFKHHGPSWIGLRAWTFPLRRS